MNQTPETKRCAIYTRKSTEEGLDQDFNTLDAQRDSAEAYITSQQHEGWTCIAERYDDGGFTGANMERPALRRLLDDIQAGKVDCVVVYKVDRLSRSLLDFARILEIFEKFQVGFVSVTQQMNTSTSMGRLMLNVLLSFAQFERELISERTHDKMAAARRKGKRCGGAPVLGYDVVEKQFAVNPTEADRVRQIFDLYLKCQSLIETARQLNDRGWVTKRWTTRAGKVIGGLAFNKTNLHYILTNVTCIGKVKYRDEIYEGEHEGIVDPKIFAKVQKCLTTGKGASRTRHTSLLRGLLHCSACGCGMSHAYSQKRNYRYHYYVCNKAQKRGWKTCPAPSVPAIEIERFVVDEIKAIGSDAELAASVYREACRHLDEERKQLKAEALKLQRQIARDEKEIRRLATGVLDEAAIDELARLQDRVRVARDRLAKIKPAEPLTQAEVIRNLAAFDPVWQTLSSGEQGQLLDALIDRIDFDGENENVSISFHATGLKAIEEVAV